MTNNKRFATNPMTGMLGGFIIIMMCVMTMGFDLLDLVFSSRCLNFYLQYTHDAEQLSQFEQIMCIIG